MPTYVKRVLIVEDDLDICEFFELILGHYHIDVRTAQTAQAAMEIMQWFEPDMMVIDFRLPDMDGWQLVRELRALEKLSPDVRLIAVTGYHAAKASQAAMEAGFYAYFSKPIDPSDFAQTLIVKRDES